MSRTIKRKAGYASTSHISGWTEDYDRAHAEANELHGWGSYRSIPLTGHKLGRAIARFHSGRRYRRLGDYKYGWDSVRAKYRESLTYVVGLVNRDDIEDVDVVEYEHYHYHDWD